MRFKKVLLITPPVKADQGSIRPNIGLGYLAQVLEEHRIDYDILDMLLGYALDDLRKKVESFSPDLLGVNLFSNKYKTAYHSIEAIKHIFPHLTVVVGGPHVSCLREQVLEDCQAVDYGVYLEGEDALLELCAGKSPEKIKNLIYRDGGTVKVNSQRNFIRDLDSIPFPTYQKFETGKYIEEKSLISSRGCPYDCTYCAVKVVSGQKVRLRSPEKVVDEMEYWYRKGTRQFSFQDDNFTFSKQRIYDFCQEIEARGFEDVFLRCAGARADKLDHGTLSRMKEVGFKTIAMGVEVGNNKMLEIIKKGEKFEDIDQAVCIACELGFDVYLNFLAGVPFETLTDIRDSIDFALKYPVFYAEWSNIIPYPGTEMYAWLKRKGYLLKEAEEYLNDNSTTSNVPVFETPELPLEERKKLLVDLKKVRKKILRRGMARRLQHGRIPGVISQLIAFIVSQDSFNKFLFQNRIRRIADLVRFGIYMKKNPTSDNN